MSHAYAKRYLRRPIQALSILLLATLFAGACTTGSRDYYEPERRTIGKPAFGVVSTARPGSVLYREASYLFHDSIRVTARAALGEQDQYTIEPGYYDRVTGEQRGPVARFAAGNFEQSGSIRSAQGTPVDAWLEPGTGNALCLVQKRRKKLCSEALEFQRLMRRQQDMSALERSIVFRGTGGELLSLSYRETSPELASVMYEKALKLNARQSKIISVSGLAVEILETSPALMKYRVNTGFRAGQYQPAPR